MTAKLVDGRALRAALEERVAHEVRQLAREGPVRLTAVSVGSAGASDVYLRNQSRACQRVGIRFRHDRLPESTTQQALTHHLRTLAADPRVTGIILQMPLPPHLDARAAQASMDPRKDVEGIHHENVGRLARGSAQLAPCTALAAVHVLESEQVTLEGAEAVVIGHSEIVGKPLALLLLDRLATVTVCHIATRDLASHTRRADVLCVAVGRPDLVRADMIQPGASVVDIGINVIDDGEGGSRVVGDVSADAREVAGLLTPVPGGLGPVTVGMLLRNTVFAAQLQRGHPPGLRD